MSMAALPLPLLCRTRVGGSGSLFFITVAARFTLFITVAARQRRGSNFYFPSRRGSDRCSAAMDISALYLLKSIVLAASPLEIFF
jgi:hypothetical protein